MHYSPRKQFLFFETGRINGYSQYCNLIFQHTQLLYSISSSCIELCTRGFLMLTALIHNIIMEHSPKYIIPFLVLHARPSVAHSYITTNEDASWFLQKWKTARFY